MPDFDSAVSSFLREGMDEVEARMRAAGERAVEYNKEQGNYRNRTGNLRASNYYEVGEEGLVVGNKAEYASDVEARGYMVCSEGALLAERLLNGNEGHRGGDDPGV